MRAWSTAWQVARPAVTPRALGEAACTSYGFEPGTVNFSQCLQQQSLARDYLPAADY